MATKVFLSTPAAAYPNYVSALAMAGAAVAETEAESRVLVLPGGGDLDPAFYGRENCGSVGIDPMRDREELALCARFLEAGKPILGICRGAQVLAVALGGTLLQDVAGHSALEHGDRLHDTRTAGVLTRLYGPYCTVNSSHHQALEQAPPDCRILQLSDDGVIEAFSHQTRPLLGVQWHPERLCGAFARPDAVDGLILLRWFLSLCRS